MQFSVTPLDAIHDADIRNLVDERAREGHQIEFKQALPGGGNEDKREFLADVSSFANALGGDIVYGIVDEGGAAAAVAPFTDINVDQEVLRLEHIIRSGIDPRIPGVRAKAVAINGGWILVVRVPRSWAAPHMVSALNTSRFYSRTSAGKYQLDVRELRTLFMMSEGVEERTRSFRSERLGRIVAGDTPFVLRDAPKLVLHIVPFSGGTRPPPLDLSPVVGRPDLIRPLSAYGLDFRHNLDGFATFFSSHDRRTVLSYVQVFRDGAVEAVDARMLMSEPGDTKIPVSYAEEKLIEVTTSLLAAQRILGVSPPMTVMISLLGVRGFSLAVSAETWPLGGGPIDRETLLLPEIVIEDPDNADVSAVLKPVLDALWNAGGWPRSLNYSETGHRLPGK